MKDFLVDALALSDPRHRQRRGTQTTELACSSVGGRQGTVLENVTVRAHVFEGCTLSQQDYFIRSDIALKSLRKMCGLRPTEPTMASSRHWNISSQKSAPLT